MGASTEAMAPLLLVREHFKIQDLAVVIGGAG